ncbi:MAG: 7TM-DISM domain-containing protein [Syntrophotaleaceae bacterium]
MLFLLMGCFFTSLLLSSVPAEGAAPILRLDDGGERYEVGPYLEILEDPGGEKSIAEVASPAVSGQFAPVNARTVNRGVGDSIYWLRFSLHGTPPSTGGGTRLIPWLLDIGWPFFHSVQAYLVYNGAAPDQRQIEPVLFYQVFRPIGNRLSKDQGLLARLPQRSATEQTLYLRLQSNGVFFLHPVLSTVKSYLEHSILRMLWYGLYFGILLSLLLYNLFLYLGLRDRSYLWYVTSIAAIGVYFAGVDRLTYEFLLDYPPSDFLRLTLATLPSA